jgi:hypothetical protein
MVFFQMAANYGSHPEKNIWKPVFFVRFFEWFDHLKTRPKFFFKLGTRDTGDDIFGDIGDNSPFGTATFGTTARSGPVL